MQETPHFSELVESSAEIAASNLNTQWHVDSTLLDFIVSHLQTSIKYISNLKITHFPQCWAFLYIPLLPISQILNCFVQIKNVNSLHPPFKLKEIDMNKDISYSLSLSLFSSRPLSLFFYSPNLLKQLCATLHS